MGWFEDIVVNAKSAADIVGKEAGKAIDISKLKIMEAEIKNEMKKIFENLGRDVYSSMKNEISIEDQTEKYINKIDELNVQLKAVEEQIIALKKKIKCKICDFENPEDSMFCSKCGNKLKDSSVKQWGPDLEEENENQE